MTSPTDPRLITLEHLHELLRQNYPDASEWKLLQLAHVADEVVESIVGPLGAPPYRATWHEAADIIAVHLAERYAGAVPVPLGGGSDENGVYGRGFAIPSAARELLELTLDPRGSQAPRGSFPLPLGYPDAAERTFW